MFIGYLVHVSKTYRTWYQNRRFRDIYIGLCTVCTVGLLTLSTTYNKCDNLQIEGCTVFGRRRRICQLNCGGPLYWKEPRTCHTEPLINFIMKSCIEYTWHWLNGNYILVSSNITYTCLCQRIFSIHTNETDIIKTLSFSPTDRVAIPIPRFNVKAILSGVILLNTCQVYVTMIIVTIQQSLK